jgi:phage terminase small subunit
MGIRGRKSRAELAAARLMPPVTADKPSSSMSEPPAHLRPETKAWWQSIITEQDIQPHQLRTLLCAAEAWDRKEEARAALNEHGLSYVDDRGMIRQRPEVAVERDSRTAYLRAMRELKLDAEPPKEKRLGGIGITYEQLQGRR